MKMNKFLLGFLILSVVCTAFAQRIARQFDDDVERGDKFIDDLIDDMMRERGHEYDPYYLEDGSVGFNKKVMFVNVSGEAKLSNGYLLGLTTLERADHCTLSEDGDEIQVKADLRAGILQCHYDGTVKFMNWGPTISITGEIKLLEIHMEFSTNAKTGVNGALEQFYIEDMKGMSVKITGLGPLNWAANYLIAGVTKMLKGFIKKMIETQIRSHVAERLPQYRFPVDNPITDIPETAAPETEQPIEEAFPLFEKFIF